MISDVESVCERPSGLNEGEQDCWFVKKICQTRRLLSKSRTTGETNRETTLNEAAAARFWRSGVKNGDDALVFKPRCVNLMTALWRTNKDINKIILEEGSERRASVCTLKAELFSPSVVCSACFSPASAARLGALLRAACDLLIHLH